MSAVPYFDAHCDTLTAVYEHGGGLFENAYQLDLSRLSAYSPCAQVFAVWNGDFEAKAALLRRECAARPGLVSFCRTPGEARAANAEGRIAALLSVEGAVHASLFCKGEDGMPKCVRIALPFAFPVRCDRAHAGDAAEVTCCCQGVSVRRRGGGIEAECSLRLFCTLTSSQESAKEIFQA